MSSRHRNAAKERKAREEQERLARESEATTRRRWQIAAAVAGMGVLAFAGYGLVLFATAPEDDAAIAAASASASSTASAGATSASSTDEETTDEDGWSDSASAPPTSIAEDTTWTVTMDTNQGEIVLELDGEAAPQAVSSFLALAEEGFFDSTECHRVTTEGIYILQCGDPLGTGVGGPDYRFGPIENAPEDGTYVAGTLAMARQSASTVGADAAAESMGSQFFIVYEDSDIPDDAAGGYTVFGQVVSGLGIVEHVAEVGTITGDSDGRPALSVIVNEVSVS